MKNSQPKILITGITAATLMLMACSEKSYPLPNSFLHGKTETRFGVGDFGNVPSLTEAGSAAFEHLVGPGGTMLTGKLKVAATAIVDSPNKLSCALAAGTEVVVNGKRGHYLLIGLDTPCTAGGKTFREGYVKIAEVDVNEAQGASAKQLPGTGSTPAGATGGSTTPSGTTSSNNLPSNENFVATGGSTTTFGTTSSSNLPSNENFVGCQNVIQIVLQNTNNDVSHENDRYNAKDDKSISDEGCFSEEFAGKTGACAIPGNIFRRGGITQSGHDIGLVITGSAAQFKIKVKFNDKDLNETPLNAAEFKTANGKYIIPMQKFVPLNNKWGGFGEKGSFEIVALNTAGAPVGSSCVHNYRVISPLVLDLVGSGMFEGSSAAASNVRFDLLGNGQLPQVGWVKPSMGFVAIDLNNNGAIDDGRELFGEGTRLANGKNATNGYEAISALDTNANGFLDAGDELFDKAVVWTDKNSDGVSAKDEIVPLAKMGITKIGVAYGPSMRHSGKELMDNDVRFEGRYWGPTRCGTEGCLSFDVFFQTAWSVSYSK